MRVLYYLLPLMVIIGLVCKVTAFVSTSIYKVAQAVSLVVGGATSAVILALFVFVSAPKKNNPYCRQQSQSGKGYTNAYERWVVSRLSKVYKYPKCVSQINCGSNETGNSYHSDNLTQGKTRLLPKANRTQA